MTTVEGSHFKHSYCFEVSKKSDEEIATDHPSADQWYWALMRDHFRRGTGKGTIDLISKQNKICYEGCVNRWIKTKSAEY